MHIKHRIKRLLLGRRCSGLRPVVVASIGRCGSTLAWYAAVKAQARVMSGKPSLDGVNAIWPRLVKADCWDLASERLAGGLVYKTHDFPYALNPADAAKAVFIYGRPSDVILSLVHCRTRFGAAWVAKHFRHLHARGRYEEMFDNDILRFGEQVDAWSATANAPVLGLRYETLWQNVGVMSDFLGYPVVLPTRQNRRRPHLAPELIAQVRSTYAGLDAKVAALPDYFLAGSA